MGIKAKQHGINMVGTTADVVKEIAADPRRISAIRINIHFLNNYSDKERRLLERTANTCAVRNSLSDELAVEIHFNYPDK